ncbi:excisionase family DNA-binding protein [Propioniciclava sp. MC1683]|uniref:helix-turn-helix transcriptional regulator n=1 Tax=Propioniciclava sp. MC1683 TaxID=2760309 RepID=UPI0016043EC7|nr:helix-turn-helix domain-containing protein [Propioniciclava sp. MC1683]MBB1502270.1 excisionase family DNA-binding protein [Propioniciclava sp. MC1683]
MASTATRKHTHPETARFVSQDAAAERWGVSVDTIRRMISSGRVTGYRLNNRIIRVDLAEVDAAFRPIPTVGNAGGAR